ncbi:hypothetical protein GCM10027612_68130 [Microbispora bryophytorum subsp. camponoti]
MLTALRAHRAALDPGIAAERHDRHTFDAPGHRTHAALVLRGDRPDRALVQQVAEAHQGVTMVDGGCSGGAATVLLSSTVIRDSLVRPS